MSKFDPQELQQHIQELQSRLNERSAAINAYLQGNSNLPDETLDSQAQQAWQALGGLTAYHELSEALQDVSRSLQENTTILQDTLTGIMQNVDLSHSLETILSWTERELNTIAPEQRAYLIASIQRLRDAINNQKIDFSRLNQARARMRGAFDQLKGSESTQNFETSVHHFAEQVERTRSSLSDTQYAALQIEAAWWAERARQVTGLQMALQPVSFPAKPSPDQLIGRMDALWLQIQNVSPAVLSLFREKWVNEFKRAWLSYKENFGGDAETQVPYLKAVEAEIPAGLPPISSQLRPTKNNLSGIGVWLLSSVGLLAAIAAIILGVVALSNPDQAIEQNTTRIENLEAWMIGQVGSYDAASSQTVIAAKATAEVTPEGKEPSPQTQPVSTTFTSTFTQTATLTLTPRPPTHTATPSNTPTPEPTSTPSPTSTDTATPEPTDTPTPDPQALFEMAVEALRGVQSFSPSPDVALWTILPSQDSIRLVLCTRDHWYYDTSACGEINFVSMQKVESPALILPDIVIKASDGEQPEVAGEAKIEEDGTIRIKVRLEELQAGRYIGYLRAGDREEVIPGFIFEVVDPTSLQGNDHLFVDPATEQKYLVQVSIADTVSPRTYELRLNTGDDLSPIRLTLTGDGPSLNVSIDNSSESSRDDETFIFRAGTQAERPVNIKWTMASSDTPLSLQVVGEKLILLETALGGQAWMVVSFRETPNQFAPGSNFYYPDNFGKRIVRLTRQDSQTLLGPPDEPYSTGETNQGQFLSLYVWLPEDAILSEERGYTWADLSHQVIRFSSSQSFPEILPSMTNNLEADKQPSDFKTLTSTVTIQPPNVIGQVRWEGEWFYLVRLDGVVITQ